MTVEDLRPGDWHGDDWPFPLAGDTRFTWTYDAKTRTKRRDGRTAASCNVECDVVGVMTRC